MDAYDDVLKCLTSWVLYGCVDDVIVPYSNDAIVLALIDALMPYSDACEMIAFDGCDYAIRIWCDLDTITNPRRFSIMGMR